MTVLQFRRLSSSHFTTQLLGTQSGRKQERVSHHLCIKSYCVVPLLGHDLINQSLTSIVYLIYFLHVCFHNKSPPHLYFVCILNCNDSSITTFLVLLPNNSFSYYSKLLFSPYLVRQTQ